MHRVGDILKLLDGTVYHLVYASQSMDGKFRCKIIESSNNHTAGYILWQTFDKLEHAKKIGHKKVFIPKYTVGDQLIVVGGCCDNTSLEGEVVTYLRKLHTGNTLTNYPHKIKVELPYGGTRSMCVYCTKPNAKQMSLF